MLWNQAAYSSLHPQDGLQRLHVTEFAYGSWWTTACYCCAAEAAALPWSLSLLCLCKPGTARHACLPGSTYSSEGHITALEMLLWAVVQPLPMSIFSLNWNKIHPTGKAIVSLREKATTFFCAPMRYISCCSMCFLKTYGNNFSIVTFTFHLHHLPQVPVCCRQSITVCFHGCQKLGDLQKQKKVKQRNP